MSPASDINLEIAPDTKPIRFGSRLLKADMDNVKELIENLKEKIMNAANNVEEVPLLSKQLLELVENTM